MSRVMKQAIVSEFSRRLEDHDSAVVVSAGALTVEETETLRTALRQEDIELMYLRNRLAKIAFEKTGFDGLEQVFSGPAAIAVGGEDGAIGISKVMAKHAKTMKTLEILGGYIDGEVLDKDGVDRLSKTPGKKELQSMVLAGMFGAVSDFHQSMGDLLTEMHGLFEALEKEKGAEG